MAKGISNLKKQSCITYSKRRKFRPKMRQNAFGGRAPAAPPGPAAGSLSAPPDPLAAIGGGVPTSNGEGREGDGKREGRGGKGRKGREGEGRKGRGGREGEAIVNWTPPATKTWRRA